MNLARFPRRRYTQGQTPIEKLSRLSRALGGPTLYIKRDDLLGLAGGGSKTRKLEFLVADALRQKADTLITGGAVQSNHCRLTLAAAVAYRRDLQVIVTGVCETDFSGYPDCRDDTMKAMQLALSLGMDKRFLIETPLMWIDKAATWQRAHDIGERSDVAQGGDALVNLIIEHTHTCYLGDRVHRHAWGWGCGGCPACELRAQGYRRWIEHRMGMAGVPR